jgi:hypothetical protein
VLAAGFLAITAGVAAADYAPPVRILTRDAVAAACVELGAAGKSWGLEAEQGGYGCQNTTTGQAVMCQADGSCKDYVGDPRWRRVRDVVDRYSKKQPRLQPI